MTLATFRTRPLGHFERWCPKCGQWRPTAGAQFKPFRCAECRIKPPRIPR
jgi:tRNA(Ile2) C34 agmatinyltransferase TiaS